MSTRPRPGAPPSARLPAGLAELVTEALGTERVRRDVPLGPLTTYRVGGPAALLVEVHHEDDLARLAGILAAHDPVPVLVVGRGSNLLVADRGVAGVVITLGAGLAGSRVEGTTLTGGGAASLPVLARTSVAAGLTGFEWAVGVPGSLGGAVRMNAGGHGSDMAACVRRARLVSVATGECAWWDPERLAFGYRRSAVSPTDVVVAAEIALAPGDPDEGRALLDEIVTWRRRHQPGGRNAGSVFTNPPGDSAGRLVDAAGLKGLRIGGAAVSAKHANFIQCDATASAADVLALMARVRREVAARFGVVLEPETRLAGFHDDETAPVTADPLTGEVTR